MHGGRAKPSDFLGLDLFLSGDGDQVGTVLDELAEQLASAVASFVGLTVTLVDDDGELVLTAAAPADQGAARTSLAFSVVQPDGRSARFVVQAGQPGALVDLHADLGYLSRSSGGRTRFPVDVRIDEDLGGPALVPGVVGLERRSTLHRAEGILLQEGVDPDEVAAELRRRATADDTDLHVYARRMLDAASGSPDEGR